MRAKVICLMTLVFMFMDIQAKEFQECMNDTLQQTQDSLWYHRTHQLDSVVIVGDNIIHYADRDVVRITRAMRRGARNTAQMLGNIPGIDCDYSNNALTYYGSSNILILVDSIEKSADYVKELHHLRFDKVNVIPNPTGKYANYDVLINLHTKPNFEGYEGNLYNYTRVLPSGGNGKNKNLVNDNSSASFTYTKNKWNFVGRYNFNFKQSEIFDMEKTESRPLNKLQETYLSPKYASDFFRIHNFYTAVDYQVNKDHSISVSYNFSTDASDKYVVSDIERVYLDTQNKDTITKSSVNAINSTRHTVGLYYRGRSGVWNYTYDFNYINDGWRDDNALWQSSGYSSDYKHDNHMNYIWTKSEVNRRFFNEKFYVSAGYNFTWKDYEQKDRTTEAMLSENKYIRNEFWTWMSYRIKDGTDLNFSASVEHVHTKSNTYNDNDFIYKFSGMFFHRWNKWLWMRLNYWCDVSHPQLNQVSEYGYFTDSLTWCQGNPALKTNVNHSGRIWLDFFKLFNIQGGFSYSPNSISTVADISRGVLPSGNEGYYITYIPQNTKYKSFWTSFYIYKKVKDFTLSTFLRYDNKEAEYKSYKNSNDGLSGNVSARYYNEKHRFSLSLGYNLGNMYDASVQGLSTRKFDFFNLGASKTFFNQKLGITLNYTLPIFFTKMTYVAQHNSAALNSIEHLNIRKSNANALMLSISYRFYEGKSVRQYNRNMSDEK
jgi:hypothetical protein